MGSCVPSSARIQHPEPARAVIREDIPARERRLRVAAVDVPAGHGAALAVVVLRDRFREALGVAGRVAEAVEALRHVPAVVEAADPGPGDVDLLPFALPHIADPEIARAAVEADPPRVAQAGEPDLRARPIDADEGVVRRDAVRRIRPARVDVDAQDLRQQGARDPDRSPADRRHRRRRRSRCGDSRPARRPGRRRCDCRTRRPCAGGPSPRPVTRRPRRPRSRTTTRPGNRRVRCSTRTCGRRPGRDGRRDPGVRVRHRPTRARRYRATARGRGRRHGSGARVRPVRRRRSRSGRPAGRRRRADRRARSPRPRGRASAAGRARRQSVRSSPGRRSGMPRACPSQPARWAAATPLQRRRMAGWTRCRHKPYRRPRGPWSAQGRRSGVAAWCAC